MENSILFFILFLRPSLSKGPSFVSGRISTFNVFFNVNYFTPYLYLLLSILCLAVLGLYQVSVSTLSYFV